MAAKKNLLFKIGLFRKDKPTSGKVPLKTFFFAVNPQSYSVQEHDRISKARTWGGTWAENFGPDYKTITMSGNFGLTKNRTGWDNLNAIKGGTAAIKYFRDNFVRLAERSIVEGRNLNDYYLRFYDLQPTESNRDGWIVLIDNFVVSRDAKMPYMFQWQLTMTAIGINFYRVSLADLKLSLSVKSNPFDVWNPDGLALNLGLANALSAFGIKGLFDAGQNLADELGIGGRLSNIAHWDTNSPLLKKIREMAAVIDKWCNFLTESIEQINVMVDTINTIGVAILDRSGEIARSLGSVGTSLASVTNTMTNLDRAVMDIPFKLVEEMNSVESQWAGIAEQINTAFDPKFRDAARADDPTMIQFAAEWERTMTAMGNTFGKPDSIGGAAVFAVTLGAVAAVGTLGLPAAAVGAAGVGFAAAGVAAAVPEWLVTGGYIYHGATAFVRLMVPQIAYEPAKATPADIAAKYGLPSPQALVTANPNMDWSTRTAADPINIPQQITAEEVVQTGNMVFDANPGGADVQIDNQTGMIVATSTGDVSTVAGFENIVAAIDRAVNTEIGALGYAPDFGVGIENVLGEVSSQETQTVVVENALSAAILQDPRVDSLDSFEILPSDQPDVVLVTGKVNLKNMPTLMLDIKVRNRDLSYLFS